MLFALMRRSGSQGAILHSPLKPPKRRGPGLAKDSRYSKIRGVLALVTLVTVILICIRYTTPYTAHAAPVGARKQAGLARPLAGTQQEQLLDSPLTELNVDKLGEYTTLRVMVFGLLWPAALA